MPNDLTPISWIEVKAVFDEPPLDWSLFVDVFERHGCENTLQEDSPPSLSSAVVEVEGSGEVIRALSNDLLIVGASRVETRSLVDEDWDEHWRKFFHPREIGKRLLIRPTWEPGPASDRLEIILDPGQAFGTGDHPTTRLCLELLERVDGGRATLNGSSVADVGCGSGVLSIAACLLGAASVCAVDIEPLSVEVAKENARINSVHFEAVVGRGIVAIAEDGPFDIVLSNIISAVLIQIAPDVFSCMKPGGIWIVSGIIVDNWPDVLVAAAEAGFQLREKVEEDGWIGASLVAAPA
ncbi:MAG: 50S ribosomal protein L11 methyltransferase [Fimbriimonadales bacterium]